MLLADVNVFIYAHRPESPRAAEHREWLQETLSGQEPFAVSEAVLASFLRIVTFHRIYRDPTPPATAMEFCRTVLEAPAAVRVRAGPRHWEIFTELVQRTGARGNTVPDAYLAALAIENGCTWVTHDAGFARFPGLRWRHPLGS